MGCIKDSTNVSPLLGPIFPNLCWIQIKIVDNIHQIR